MLLLSKPEVKNAHLLSVIHRLKTLAFSLTYGLKELLHHPPTFINHMAEGIKEKLHSFGLYYNQPEPAVICISCGFALKTNTDRVSRHLGEAHGLARKARRGLNQLIKALNLPDPGELPPRPEVSETHPHLALQNGAACKHCSFRSVSLKVLSRHLRLEHKDKIKQRSSSKGGWLQDHILEQLQFRVGLPATSCTHGK